MTVRAMLEEKIDILNEQISSMERVNDGSVRWVEELNSLISDLQEAESMLNELGGYREAGYGY